MSERDLGNYRLDLSAAFRILQQAGRADALAESNDSNTQIQRIIDALCDLSVHDGLTGLVNATFFHAVLEREISRSRRTGRTCGLMVIDIDFFKQINDTHGHKNGDLVLQSLAAQLKNSLRTMDTAARIGGEEFAIILPECTPEDAIQVARRIHSVINPLIVLAGPNTLRVTSSIGLVWTDPNASVSSPRLLSEADQEMYRAKRSGRGRLCYMPAESAPVSAQERSALMVSPIEENGHVR